MLLMKSSRYANLNLKEEDLIKGGRHVLCAYIMKPKAGYDYLSTAAHFSAESSTGTNVEVCTTDDFTKGVDSLMYEIDEAREIMKIAYPVELFDRNIIDGRAMMASFLTLTIGNNQGMGDVEYAKMHDFYVPPAYLRLFDGPAMNIQDMWRVLGRPMVNGGMVVGTIIKPKLGLRPQPFADEKGRTEIVELDAAGTIFAGEHADDEEDQQEGQAEPRRQGARQHAEEQ